MSATVTHAASPIRVLLVEDDENDYRLTRDLLAQISDTPFELEWISDYARARAALAEGRHDICLLDDRLGEHSGLDLLREASAAGYEMPIIILTARGDREIDLQAMQAGAAYYLAKSGIDAQSLERSIRYTLELRRAERRARASSARASAVLDHVVDGMIAIDAQGIVESFNPAAARLFGYSADEVIGRNLSMLMAEPYRSAHDSCLATYLRTGAAKIIGKGREVLGRHKDGHSIPIDLAVSEMHVDGERKFVGTVRDITERKRAEDLLRTRAHQHEALAELGVLALASTTAAAVLEGATRVVAETLDVPISGVCEVLPDGCTLRLAAGIGWRPGVIGELISSEKATIARLVLGTQQPVVFHDLRTDARFMGAGMLLEQGVVSGVAVIIRGQEREQVLGILGAYTTEPRAFTIHDVHFLDAVAALLAQGLLRHRAEAALRESEERLQLMVEAANIGLWDWDVTADRIYYSPQWKAQLGYADHELQSHPGQWENHLHPEDREVCMRRLRKALRGSAARYEDEFRMRHRDGSYRWITTRGAVLRNAAGKAYRMFGAHVDITARREAEDAVRRLNAELERRVAERTAQFEAANRELEAFSYSVSHDLRAPLRAIDGFAQALIEEYADVLPPTGQHFLARVRAGANRMGELIDDLLKLARVTRSEMRQQDVDLSGLAVEVAAELRQREPERAVDVSIEGGHLVRGDPVLLRLALENLLGNAWKYTGKRDHAHIAFGGLADNGERVFYVRDDGAGFDPAYADKLFGPFQRLHGSEEFEGTGVGLATVQRIVHRHGGRVWAEAAVGTGATFYFTLVTAAS